MYVLIGIEHSFNNVFIYSLTIYVYAVYLDHIHSQFSLPQKCLRTFLILFPLKFSAFIFQIIGGGVCLPPSLALPSPLPPEFTCSVDRIHRTAGASVWEGLQGAHDFAEGLISPWYQSLHFKAGSRKTSR